MTRRIRDAAALVCISAGYALICAGYAMPPKIASAAAIVMVVSGLVMAIFRDR